MMVAVRAHMRAGRERIPFRGVKGNIVAMSLRSSAGPELQRNASSLIRRTVWLTSGYRRAPCAPCRAGGDIKANASLKNAVNGLLTEKS